MKRSLLTILSVLFVLYANAQKQDTTIYQGCRLAHDTTHYIGDKSKIVFVSCPEFKSGGGGLYKYISSHNHYPKNTRKNQAQGRVIISMIIEKDGSVSHARVVRGVGKEIDKEALIVVNSLPKWKPGILNGKPVRVKYIVVISSQPSGNKL